MVIDDLVEIAEKERAARKKYVIRCCMAAGCMSSDSKGVKEQLEKAVADAGLQNEVEVRGVGCMKLCCEGPLVAADPGSPTLDVLIEHPLDFEAAYSRRERRRVAEVEARVASVADMITLKERAGRRQDRDDVEHLRRLSS